MSGAQRIGVRALRQLLLDVAHAVVAEVTDQAAIEARQTGDGRDVIARELLDEGQRVSLSRLSDLDAVDGTHADLVAVHAQHGARRQADDRVAAPFLAALHGFQQVGVGVSASSGRSTAACRNQPGFESQRDAVETVGGQAQEFFTVHENSLVGGKTGVRQTRRNQPARKSQARQRQRPGP